jgi:hypothetical protein
MKVISRTRIAKLTVTAIIGLVVPVSSVIGAVPAIASTNFPCGSGGTYTVSAANVLTTFSPDCSGAVVIDPSVTSIDISGDFLPQGVTSIAIPAATTTITYGSGPRTGFFANRNLNTITVAASNPTFTAIDGVLFNKDVTTLFTYPPSKVATTYSVPNTVTTLYDYSFNGTRNLSTLTIPATLATWSSVTVYNESSIARVDVDSSNTNFKSIDGVLYSKDGSALIFYPHSKSDLSFVIPNTVTDFSNYAITSTTLLQHVVLPSGLKTIGFGAFEFNYSLKSISTIPATVTAIQENVFYGSSALPAINVDPANPNFKSINGVLFNKAGTILIAYPSGAMARSYTLPSTVAVINNSSFFNEFLEYLSVPQTVTSQSFFGYLSALKSINYCSTDGASRTALLRLGRNYPVPTTMVCDLGLTITNPASDTIFQMKAAVEQTIPISVQTAVAPYTIEVTAGTLPSGLRISSDSSSIIGTPTTPGSSFGISLTATDVFGYSHTVTGLSFNVAANKEAADKAAADKAAADKAAADKAAADKEAEDKAAADAEAAAKMVLDKAIADAKAEVEAAAKIAQDKAVADAKATTEAAAKIAQDKAVADAKAIAEAAAKIAQDKAVADAKATTEAAAKIAQDKAVADAKATAEAAAKIAQDKAVADAKATAEAVAKVAAEAVAKAAADKAATDKIISDAKSEAASILAEAKAKVAADKEAADKAALTQAQIELAAANASLADSQKTIREQAAKIASFEEQFRTLSESVNAMQSQVAQLNSKFVATTSNLKTANAKIKKICSVKPKPKGC